MKSEFDASRWPLLVIRYAPEMTQEEMGEVYVEWDKYLARGAHAVYIDIRASNPLLISASVRRFAAEQVELRRARFEELLVAEGRCVSGVLMKNIVTAFDWMVGSTFKRPLQNFSSYRDGEAWLEAILVKKNMMPTGESRAPL